MSNYPLVLASTSPRRRELLTQAGFRFQLEKPGIDEFELPGESPEEQAQRLASEKGRAVADRMESGLCVLSADTLVVIDRQVLGKPVDEAEAARMLLSLAGRTHRVLTGFALILTGTERFEVAVIESLVHMHPVTPEEAKAYAHGGEPLDKAGAYAVQGEGGRFVAGIDGSRTNVIGLPLEAVTPRLDAFGVRRM
ncbi:MAG: septum formation protein Maf [bacterium]|nr:septum formation protein Maf [bacterium]